MKNFFFCQTPIFSYGLFALCPTIINSMKRYGIALCFFLSVLWCATSQQQEVFAPFVSRLKASADETSITLTWVDSEDLDGDYAIFRHTEEITESNFDQAEKIAHVDSGTEYYIDRPPDKQTYFYAVLAEKDSTLYKLFIPFRNKTISGVSIEQLVTIEDLAAAVTNIEALEIDDSVVVRFDCSTDKRELIVYRSTSPIHGKSDIAEATTLRIIPSSKRKFQDFPIPGVDYYYGIIDTGLMKAGKILFRPGVNATQKPVRISFGERIGLPSVSIRRTLPLPLHPITIEIDTGDKFSQLSIDYPQYTVPLSPSTSKAIASLLKKSSIRTPSKPTPVILEAERATQISGGEEYTLKVITEESFSHQQWEQAEKELKEFLSIHHSELVEKRARFYLGQVYYYRNKLKQAFMEFLLARDTLFSQVEPWLDAIFRELRELG